jgi:hypothetical protein
MRTKMRLRKREEFSLGMEIAFSKIGYPIRKAASRYYDMHQRCGNPRHKLYPHYGERGICVDISRDDFLFWFQSAYPDFQRRHPGKRPSVSRKNNDLSYTLDNISLETVHENTKELYGRRGNPSPSGTLIDDMACLTIHTFKGRAGLLSKHYGVTFQAIRFIQRGINRKELYKVLVS